MMLFPHPVEAKEKEQKPRWQSIMPPLAHAFGILGILGGALIVAVGSGLLLGDTLKHYQITAIHPGYALFFFGLSCMIFGWVCLFYYSLTQRAKRQ